MTTVVDVIGGIPLLGRLRGVRARHELRQFLMVHDHNYLKVNDASLAFHRDVPLELPDLITTSERQLVVSLALAEVLKRQDETLEIVPVRLVDKHGSTVSTNYVIAAVRTLAECTLSTPGENTNSYLRKV